MTPTRFKRWFYIDLQTHCIPVAELYVDDFHAFIKARQKLLLDLVCRVTGQTVPADSDNTIEEGDEIPTAMAHDSGLELIEVD